MPALVYRITEVLSAMVIDLPLGTKLGLFHILWTLISGWLLQTRGALIPALAATVCWLRDPSAHVSAVFWLCETRPIQPDSLA
jgi:hypothetical protein